MQIKRHLTFSGNFEKGKFFNTQETDSRFDKFYKTKLYQLNIINIAVFCTLHHLFLERKYFDDKSTQCLIKLFSILIYPYSIFYAFKYFS